MAYTDKSLECVDCGASFVFDAGEQEFFATKGYTNEPKPLPSVPNSQETTARWFIQRQA